MTMAHTQDNAPTTMSQGGPSITPTALPAPKSGNVVALAVTLSLVGVLLAAGVAFFILRTRRARSEQITDEKDVNLSPRKSIKLDHRHPASHITPFGNHIPGTNMRIARRRLDGAWDFEDPEAPFEPDGVTDPCPSPLSASSKRSTIKRKTAEAKTELDRRRDTDGSSLRGLELPPPAYHPEHHSDEGYTNRKD